MIQIIMVHRQPYTLIYPPEVKRHLRTIDSKYRSLIRQKIQEQLLYEPALETTNRKPLRQPAAFAAQWELRLGPDNRFRVLYDVREPEREVHILAIGVKERDRLIVGGQEIDL